jgi:SAM-dependent methyltransferase
VSADIAARRPYPLNNHDPHSAAHHGTLGELLDPATTGRLATVGGWAGAICLEVGAGSGSIARWLAEQVGPSGQVVATDIEPHLIAVHPRLRVLRHDLRTGDPLPEGPFDLIHARLVLAHLPEREQILRRLVDHLSPSGTILIEDWAPLRHREDVVVAAPNDAAAAAYARYQHCVGTHVFDAAGTDAGWARRMHTSMLTAGLVDVDTRVQAAYWTGGGAGCRFITAVVQQVRPRLLAAGMSNGELDTVLQLLKDPRLIIHGHPLYATSGRTPLPPR